MTRALDAMYARIVLGLEVKPHRADDTGHLHEFDHENQRSRCLRRYTESLDAVLPGLEKVRQSGKWCCINIHSDHHYLWEVTLIPHDSPDHRPTITVQTEDHKELPLIVAKALLLASGVTQKEIDDVEDKL